MKAPDIKIKGEGGNDENFAKEEDPAKTVADFPINEKLLLDEIAKASQTGNEHIQLEADESTQHPETRGGVKEAEETRLDEVVKKAPVDYPDIE